MWQKIVFLTEVSFNKSDPPFVEFFHRYTAVTKETSHALNESESGHLDRCILALPFDSMRAESL